MSAACISVVLPNFNHGSFVGSALHALLSQSVPPAEIIVVDDASTDDSRAIIQQIAASHPSIRLLVNPANTGVIPSLNRGLDIVTQPYVYLAAADDWVMPGFFALAVQMLSQYPRAGFFCADAIIVDGASGRFAGYRPVVRPFYRPRVADANEAQAILRRFDNWMLTGSAVIRLDALRMAGGLDEACGSFADGYLLRKIALTQGFCYAPQVVAALRIFPTSVSRQTSQDFGKATTFLQAMSERISKDQTFPPWYAHLFCQRWKFAVLRLATLASPINHAFMDGLTADSPTDRRVLRLIRLVWAVLPSMERLTTLAWLTARFRPYPLHGLIATRLSRLFSKRG